MHEEPACAYAIPMANRIRNSYFKKILQPRSHAHEHKSQINPKNIKVRYYSKVNTAPVCIHFSYFSVIQPPAFANLDAVPALLSEKCGQKAGV